MSCIAAPTTTPSTGHPASAPSADPAGAPNRPRDVVVWGSAGPAYRVTDALRAAGLSVGYWLLPPATEPARITRQLIRDLEQGAIPDTWKHAPTVITLWATHHAASAAAVDMRYIHSAPGTVHVDLTPARAPAITATTVRAPLTLSWLSEEVFLPAASADALAAAAPTVTSDAARVLSALTALPSPPGHLLRTSRHL